VREFGEQLPADPHISLCYQCSPFHSDRAFDPFMREVQGVAPLGGTAEPEQTLDTLDAARSDGPAQVKEMSLLFSMLSIVSADRSMLSPTQQRRKTMSDWLDRLESLSRRQPMLVLFEDAQWADASSLELIDLAADRIRQLSVMVLVTSRPDFDPLWGGLHHVSRLTLAPLEQPDARVMVAQLTARRSIPAEAVEQIVVETDGIPLFVEELTKTVIETHILVAAVDSHCNDGGLPSTAIPPTLHDSLMARLDRLGPLKEIVQTGAAIGREFSYDLLSTIADHDAASLGAALDEFQDAGVLLRRGEPSEAVYSFKHALLRDAAYESLLKSRRQVLHRRIAEALRDRFAKIAEADPKIVAHHLTASGLKEEAIEWLAKVH